MISQKPKSADLHPGPGFRIHEDFVRLDQDLTNRFLEYEVPDISDSLNRLYAMDAAITCQTDKNRGLCGPACTVHVFPGDNLMVHKALDIAKPGDRIIVVSFGSGAGSDAFDITVTDKITERANLATKTREYIARRSEIDYATYVRYRGKLAMK